MGPDELAPLHLRAFLVEHGIDANFVSPGAPVPTVPLAARALSVPEDQILKTLVFVGDNDAFVVAIVNGTRRVDRSRLASAAAIRKPRPATPGDVIAVTGFPAGGVAPVGLPASVPVIVDAATASLEAVYGGGGHEQLLLRIRVSDVIRCNNALVADITEHSKRAGC
jgi:Cys-tRNA(Pro) deacylase